MKHLHQIRHPGKHRQTEHSPSIRTERGECRRQKVTSQAGNRHKVGISTSKNFCTSSPIHPQVLKHPTQEGSLGMPRRDNIHALLNPGKHLNHTLIRYWFTPSVLLWSQSLLSSWNNLKSISRALHSIISNRYADFASIPLSSNNSKF